MAMTGRMLAVAVAMISFVLPAPAGAQEFRVFDPMGKQDTSRCIGDPRTPLCALDTFYACLFRGDIGRCDKVGYDYKAVYGDNVPSPYAKLAYKRFREISRKTLGAANIPSNSIKAATTQWWPGDIAIRIYLEGCPPYDQCVMRTLNDPSLPYGEGCRGLHRCTEFPGHDVTFILREASGRWRYIAHYYGDDLPPGLWKRK